MEQYSKMKITEPVKETKDNSELTKFVRRFIYSFLSFEDFIKALKLSKSERKMILDEEPSRSFTF